ncbi:10188_t:CDS:2 [Acaulospora colombiana]|uniref:10188_t:CDS:1 n=1 Tax=Acaulospora colombiana TaxID=27376 RepID=A0ACA9M2Y8_9GLOM|nr:10188_t:CDS:2 [Acaulospora colombiana]
MPSHVLASTQYPFTRLHRIPVQVIVLRTVQELRVLVGSFGYKRTDNHWQLIPPLRLRLDHRARHNPIVDQVFKSVRSKVGGSNTTPRATHSRTANRNPIQPRCPLEKVNTPPHPQTGFDDSPAILNEEWRLGREESHRSGLLNGTH